MALYRAKVYSYIVRSGVDEGSRDDVFQEIFIKVHTNADKYDPERPLGPWLFTIVANEVRTHYRKRKVAEFVQLGSEEKATSITAEVISEAKETVKWLEQELSKLPFAEREVVLLCSTTALSQKDVATVLGLPVNTVKTHLLRARLRLAKSLQRKKARHLREVSS